MYSRSLSIFLASLAVVRVSADDSPTTGSLGNATVVENNPPDVAFSTSPPANAFASYAYPNGGNVQGSIYAIANPNGIGVKFKVQFSNLPPEGGPFLYHIHVNPVPADGNCTEAFGHLDPFIRGETPACDGDLPQTCQVGDLAGKHGKINSDPFEAEYTDDFASTVDGLGSFFGNRSFVFHFANATRITCGNFVQVPVVGSGVSTVTYTATATPSGTAPASTYTATTTVGVATAATTVGSGPSTVSSHAPFVTVNVGAAVAPRQAVLAVVGLLLAWSVACLL